VSTAAVIWHLWLNYSNKYDLCVGKIQINVTAHFPNGIAASYRRTECIIRNWDSIGWPGVATSRNWTTWSDTGNLEQQMHSSGVILSALMYSGINRKSGATWRWYKFKLTYSFLCSPSSHHEHQETVTPLLGLAVWGISLNEGKSVI
jgi:hypothetical protein